MNSPHPSSIRAIIVDDEFHARENLKFMLEDHCPEISVVGEAGNIDAAEKIIRAELPDLLFLDIRMPSGSEGFELLARLKDQKFTVIFVTAFKDYAIRAFQANAIHYLLKPVDPEELRDAVDRVTEYSGAFSDNEEGMTQYKDALQMVTQQVKDPRSFDRIALRHSKGFRIVMLDDILRLEAASNCTWLFFRDGTSYYDTRTLGVYAELLPTERFMRIHKSHIIDLKSVKEYTSEQGPTVILEDGTALPVSRNRLPEFQDRFRSR